LGPAYDELFRVVVEILVNERRRGHRIEELVQVAQFQAYGVRVPPIRRGCVREGKTHTKLSAIEGISDSMCWANNDDGIGRKFHTDRLDLDHS
jgi:hypothetical protein